MSSITKVFKSLSGMKRTLSTANHRLRSSNKRTFEDAIVALNSLQPNHVALSKSIQLRQQQKHHEDNYNLTETTKYLERIDGFTMESVNKMSMIHVAGSKGKGSVCTYTDAILRQHNVKTGLFTSPHLVSVTERIKLCGHPISKQLFNDYFWEVFDALQKKKSNDHDVPSYFKFLQIMAFYIFVSERVDVAIIEVGIGGQYDSTNIIENTEIVGITSLQLEHTQLLGDTLSEIAWQKAGIIKENSNVYTTQQPPDCMKVISDRFIEKKAKTLSVTQAFDDYKWTDSSPDFTKTEEVIKINFSLATQLSAKWLRNRNKLSESLFKGELLHSIDDNFLEAFRSCQFAGRFQKIERDHLTYFLDGAHTKDSMAICSRWFKKQVESTPGAINILVFNVTGDRDSAAFLSTLHALNFHYVCFSTNIPNVASDNGKCENFNGASNSVQLNRCILHKEIWQNMNKARGQESQLSVCPTIQEALEIIHDIKDNNFSAHINVLFTGSLYLVGSTLGLLNSSSETKMKLRAKVKRIRS